MALNILYLIGGLVILSIGGEILVRGASRLARSLGVSPLVVGLTIVAFGTSAPELAVSVSACLKAKLNPELIKQYDFAIGNVVGSNIANILLVLGLVALIRPPKVSLNIAKLDAPYMLLACGVFYAFAFFNGHTILFWQGAVLVASLAFYLWLTYKISGRRPEAEDDDDTTIHRDIKSRFMYGVLILAGLVGLKYGADFIIEGAKGIAFSLGMTERVVSLTIVAIGTSLPEIATCVIAAKHNHPDIAIGNIVGSNIFNVLSVLGIATLVAGPIPINATALARDLPIMCAAAFICIPMMWRGRKITRIEGVVLVVLYVGYLGLTLLAKEITVI